MQAASSPMMCTCGLRMVVWMGLLFLESTDRRRDYGISSRREIVYWFACFQLTVVEVKSMEVHSLHQITQPLRLEWGQAGITDLAVNTHKRVKVSNVQYRVRLWCIPVCYQPWFASCCCDTERNPSFHTGFKGNSLLFVISYIFCIFSPPVS